MASNAEYSNACFSHDFTESITKSTSSIIGTTGYTVSFGETPDTQQHNWSEYCSSNNAQRLVKGKTLESYDYLYDVAVQKVIQVLEDPMLSTRVAKIL
jgi:hypothetical protein